MGVINLDKREKDIKGLYHISNDTRLKGFMTYWGSYHDVATDAIALLKAQVPHVMTATEAYTADYVYIEFDGVITPAIRTTNERDGHRESYFATQQLGGDWMRWDDYGITWRCWTSRPTDEQREATSWEG